MAVCTLNGLEHILTSAREQSASDVILVAGSPPCVYRYSQLQRMDADELSADDIDALMMPWLSEEQKQHLIRCQDLDFAIEAGGLRCRINLHYQRRTLAAAIRFIEREVPDIESLNLPDILHEFAQMPQGMFLVTGTTGQGKTTTLAAMVEYINHNFSKHIITLEDPIEYRIGNRKSIIEQREIGSDAPSFGSALRHILRQKPDVIFVGEMRDRDTMATAITAAETGQLVLTTLHTMSAAQAVERIVDSFEGSQQQQIRVQLAHTLQAIVSQVLFEDAQHSGMVPSCEILVATHAVRRAIRENETHLLPGMIQTGAKFGMQSHQQAISELVSKKRIRKEEAMIRMATMDILEQNTETSSKWEWSKILSPAKLSGGRS